MDTIFALATATGRAGVAIVRISGPDSVICAEKLCGTVPAGRGVRRLVDQQGDLIDEALVLNFAMPHSFTGEAVIELHLHGSPAIVTAVLDLLGQDRRLRFAEAGEFTRRALENGRLDLAQVEGLADLIDAETEAQRKQAVRVFDGALGALADIWRRDLIRAAALIEATIDFADEDVPEDVLPEVRQLLVMTGRSLSDQIGGVAVAERIRDGFEVAIVGPPNAGKSTLLNRIAGRDAALTSPVAGTTRDVIEVRLDLAGYAVTLLDTAGIRETADHVEGLGVALAIKRAELADLRVFLVDGEGVLPMTPFKQDIVVRAKADTYSGEDDSVSGVTGAGVDALLDRIGVVLRGRAQRAGIAMRARHKVAMTEALDRIGRVQDMIDLDTGLDLIADELKTAIRSVDMIVGRVDVEDLLDEIFASFCIGK